MDRRRGLESFKSEPLNPQAHNLPQYHLTIPAKWLETISLSGWSQHPWSAKREKLQQFVYCRSITSHYVPDLVWMSMEAGNLMTWWALVDLTVGKTNVFPECCSMGKNNFSHRFETACMTWKHFNPTWKTGAVSNESCRILLVQSSCWLSFPFSSRRTMATANFSQEWMRKALADQHLQAMFRRFAQAGLSEDAAKSLWTATDEEHGTVTKR